MTEQRGGVNHQKLQRFSRLILNTIPDEDENKLYLTEQYGKILTNSIFIAPEVVFSKESKAFINILSNLEEKYPKNHTSYPELYKAIQIFLTKEINNTLV
tara:strand:- start:402 stop:701 length:300 start_codon:yes stop_codon:yes gene_type:complete